MDYMNLKSGTDIRGVALGDNITLTEEIASRSAAAFAKWLAEKCGKSTDKLCVAVGHDCRLSSPSLAKAAMDGLCAEGVRTLACGGATTPSMFFATRFPGTNCDGAIEITASHLPSDRNGLKFFTKEGGLESSDIAVILKTASELTLGTAQSRPVDTDIMTPYCAELVELIRQRTGRQTPFEGQKIIVNAGNGMGGFFVSGVLRPLGADTDGSVNLTPDGTFPVHIPNPENAAAMTATAKATLDSGAVLGICFDTDCDRAAIVDSTGREINSSRLIALISALLLREEAGITVVTDSVTSSGLKTFIESHGGKHHRFKRGYKNVIDEAKRLESEGISAPLAIETSGHAALKENYFLDDGAYLIVRLLLGQAEMKEGSLSDLIADLPEPKEKEEWRLTITESDFRAYGQKVMEEFVPYITQFGSLEQPSYEGVRVNFEKEQGWCLMRLSVHDPVLPINIESDKTGGCAEIGAILNNFLKKYQGLTR